MRRSSASLARILGGVPISVVMPPSSAPTARGISSSGPGDVRLAGDGEHDRQQHGRHADIVHEGGEHGHGEHDHDQQAHFALACNAHA